MIKETRAMFNEAKKDLFDKTSSITVKDKVLTIREVSAYLGVSYSTVQMMMFRDKLPYFQVGNRYRIKEQELKKWIDKSRAKNVRPNTPDTT